MAECRVKIILILKLKDNISFQINPSAKFLFVFIFLFSLTTINSKGQLSSKSVNISWQELYLYHEFGKKWDAGILFNTYVSFDHGLFNWFVQGNAGYNILPWFKLEALYRQEYYKISRDSSKWTYEMRPMLRISSSFKLNKFSFRQRNRVEVRLFELFKTRYRFRSDVRIKYSSGITSFDLSPYVTEEVFLGKGGYNRNRLYLGITGKNGRFSPILYMLMQSTNLKSQWFSQWILGAALDIKI